MAKLLRIDRKLRTLGRRLTTDANGAPCCCQGSNQCPCDPTRPLRPFPYVACIGGNYTDGSYTYVAYSTPARVAVVRAEWTIEQTYESRSSTIYPGSPTYVDIRARVQRHSGNAQWCVIPRTSGSTWSDYQWFLNNATAGFEYQSVGNRIEPVNIAETYADAEALNYYRIYTQDTRSIPLPIISVSTFAAAPIYAIPRGIIVVAGKFDNIVMARETEGNLNACSVSTNFRQVRSTSTLTQSRRFNFASNATQGGFAEVITSDNTVTNGANRGDYARESSRIQIGYTVRYLTCTTGGDPTGSLIGEPGCSNCGNASMLEPLP